MLGHLAVGAGGKDDVQYEERRPAEYKCEEHQAEHLGGLLLRGDSVGRQAVALGAIVEETVWSTQVIYLSMLCNMERELPSNLSSTYRKLSVGVATRLSAILKGRSLAWRRSSLCPVWLVVDVGDVAVTCSSG